MRQYLFFKGCTLPQKYPMLEKLAFEVFPQIGIELIETDKFSCCPDPIQVQGSNQKFWLATAARNICIAEENDLNIITLCNGCVNTLASVNYKLKNSESLRYEVNEILKDIGKEFKGTIEVKHFMQVIKDDIGFDKLKTYVKHPLNKLKIAGHPGCHILMPEKALNFDDPTDPVIYDRFIEALGATAVDHVSKTDCCGVSLTLGGEKEASNDIIAYKLRDIHQAGANLVSTPCPFCLTQLDLGQLLASKVHPEIKENPKPVLYGLELLALALGRTLEDIGYAKHKIKPELEV